MTSNDRHASHDNIYTTGQHVPFKPGQHPVLDSITTAGFESRQYLNSPYHDDVLANGMPKSPLSMTSPIGPYTPGSRSNSTHNLSKPDAGQGSDGAGEIQLQSFNEGLPPPPPVTHSWKKIDAWAETNYPELADQLCQGASLNDLNELEHALDCSLPNEVRESLQFHDGQERGGIPTGIIFGSMLLDCEEIVQEWLNWRKVNDQYLQEPKRGSAAAEAAASSNSHGAKNWRSELLAKQDCCPQNTIQKVYAHPAWIPLVRDWGGNNLAVDLAPGPAGKWGQVVLFGRDYDCKYVVARSWSAFLATVADDMSTEKWFVDEETGELKLREFKTSKVEPGYLEIIRWRMDQKYGHGPRTKITSPTTSPQSQSPTRGGRTLSPIHLSAPDEHTTGGPRGRSMQRMDSKKQPGSPYRSSPLARLADPAPAGVQTFQAQPIRKGDGGSGPVGAAGGGGFAGSGGAAPGVNGRLVEIASPPPSAAGQSSRDPIKRSSYPPKQQAQQQQPKLVDLMTPRTMPMGREPEGEVKRQSGESQAGSVASSAARSSMGSESGKENFKGQRLEV